jgi:SAM-dependent methyltransferase
MNTTLSSGGQAASQAFADASPGCPLCGCKDLAVYRDGADGNLSSSDLGSSRQEIAHGKILLCRACRFGFRRLRPSEAELSSLYRELDPRMYEQESLGRWKTAARHLKIVQRYTIGSRLLDVGCASGSFLCCAADAGWSVLGLEPAEVLCNKARQRLGNRGKVHRVSLQQADLPPASFDVVTLWDVLEHVPDPITFLERCAALLKPGGFLFANVPDLDSLPARLLRERWPLLLAEHLNYFTRESLKRCGDAAKLRFIHFGKRPASFSLDYVFFRLMQHGIRGASLGYGILSRTSLRRLCIPVWLGESYAVWSQASANRN